MKFSALLLCSLTSAAAIDSGTNALHWIAADASTSDHAAFASFSTESLFSTLANMAEPIRWMAKDGAPRRLSGESMMSDTLVNAGLGRLEGSSTITVLESVQRTLRPLGLLLGVGGLAVLGVASIASVFRSRRNSDAARNLRAAINAAETRFFNNYQRTNDEFDAELSSAEFAL